MKVLSRKARRSLVELLEGRTMLSATETATATISDTQLSASSYQYTITLTNTGTTPISTFWYGWTPQVGPLLSSAVTVNSSPLGWGTLTTTDGIEWTTSSIYAVTKPGGPATFSFTTSEAPSQLITAGVNIGYIYAGTSSSASDPGVAISPTNITAAAPSAPASTETGSATIDATLLGSGDYQYTISLTDTAATPATSSNQISTFWYAWNPAGADFLPDAPIAGSIVSPAGWTGTVTPGVSGFGIEWMTTSAPAAAGGPALTFSFDDTATPSQVITSTVNVAEIYSGAPFSDAGAVVMPTDITPVNPTPPVTPTGIEKASATILASQLTDTTYQYSLTLKNTGKGKSMAANQLGTFWYAWVPGEDFLDTSPLTVNSPAGWTDTITNEGSSDGFAIQWVATANAVKIGKSLSGFSFTTTDTPAQVFGDSNFFPGTPVNTSFVYAGAPEADTGLQFTAVGSISNKAGALLPELPVASEVTGTTVPANGDVNPYGVVFVPKGFAAGGLTATGDVLVSNFNNSSNLQGTGTTIVSVNPAGATSLFYQGPAGEGLTTALGVLRSGFVLVGNVPSTDGTSATVGQGSLLVLDKLGNQVADFEDASLLDGPWDMTVVDGGGTAHVFVSNVLSGTVTRLDLKISAKADTVTIAKQTQIASGYAHGPDPAAFELGPTGSVFTKNTLFVASTDDNAIYAIKGAATLKTDVGTGTLIYQDTTHLHGPLGLAVAPNGDLIAAQGDAVNADPNQPSELVEFTTGGQFVSQTPVDSSGEGGAFGLAVSAPIGANTEFAAVDDLTNTLDIWTIKTSLVKKH